MDKKIIEVMRKIASTPDLIGDVNRGGNEYYFHYKGHVFSILSRAVPDDRYGKYSFYVYPDWSDDVQSLASIFQRGDYENVAMVSYHSHDEDEQPFRQLYAMVESKYFNIDNIVNDILLS